MATQTLTVNADGFGSGWADEGFDYTRIQSDDGDTTRLYTPTAGSTRLLAFTDTSGLSGATINSITVTAKVRALDPVSNTVQIGVRVGSTNYWGTTKDTVTATTYQTFTQQWTTNPATSAAWTPSDLDAIMAGLQKINGPIGMAWTYMKIDVDYTAGGGGASTSKNILTLGVG